MAFSEFEAAFYCSIMSSSENCCYASSATLGCVIFGFLWSSSKSILFLTSFSLFSFSSCCSLSFFNSSRWSNYYCCFFFDFLDFFISSGLTSCSISTTASCFCFSAQVWCGFVGSSLIVFTGAWISTSCFGGYSAFCTKSSILWTKI